MEKKIYIDKNAEKELRKFSKKVQDEFEGYFKILKEEGQLDFPEAKKITKNLFKIRVRLEETYRGFYAYIGRTDIIILHLFRKKTQKTPVKNIRIAKRRVKQYE